MAIVPSLPFNLQNGQLADASQVMANFNDILNGVNANAAANGANNDITALLALTTPIGSSAGGAHDYYGGTATGTANAIVVATTLLPVSGFTLTAGKTLWFIALATNTGATQLNAAGSGLTNVFKQSPSGPVALTGGEIVSGQLVGVTYDGTQFELLNNPISAFGAQTSLPSATTTDLGLVPTHNVLITGTTPIIAFGSTATLTFPFYLVQFAGSLLITPSSTSLKMPNPITTQAGDTALLLYLGSGNWQILVYWPATAGSGGLWPALFKTGLTTSRATATTFGIAVGSCRNEDAGLPYNMTLASAFTKSLSAFAAGTGNGGLDTGAVAINSSYHMHLIRKDTDGSVDVLYSLSPTAPTMPAGYTARRRIGSFKTDGSAQIVAYIQTGNRFLLSVPGIDYDATNPGTAAVTRALASVPTGVVFLALLTVGIYTGTTAANAYIVSSLSVADTTPVAAATAALAGAATVSVASGGQVHWDMAPAEVLTDTSAQVRSRLGVSGAADHAGIITNGWVDSFGQ